MTPSAHDIAALLIYDQHAAGRDIDQMQLQMFLYLVQGANMECWGEPAFWEPIHASTHGPVVRNVEVTYRDALSGTDAITRPLGGNPDRLPFEAADTVHTVLRNFGIWTGPELANFVKGPDSAWRYTRRGLSQDDSSRREIPLSDIAAWLRRHGVNPNPEPVVAWDPTPEEESAADERLRRAKEWGAFGSDMTAEDYQAAQRALAQIAAKDHLDAQALARGPSTGHA